MMLKTVYFIGLVIGAANAFNLNVEKAIVYKGQPDSYFGYSTTIYKYNGKTSILVGSPLESGEYNGKKEHYGNVYSCEKTSSDCKSLKSLNIPGPTPNQWLGATVASSNGITLVCAPRHGSKTKGLCLSSRSNLENFSPLNQNNNQDVTLFGLSATISSDQQHFFVAEPTNNYTQGNFYGSLHQSLIDGSGIRKIHFEPLYFPSAIASGRIAQDQSGFIASVPFHSLSDFHGRVGLFRSNDQKVIHTFQGQQPGETFGSSLMVCDVNGDEKDDIFIGAAHHTRYSTSNILYDIGAVYIYYQRLDNTFGNAESVKRGNKASSQFGHSMICMGDVNLDGHYGSSPGLRTSESQKITGSSFSPSLPSFGFSLAGGVDVDNNGYNDLVVGAYQSDSVVYLPANPVVRLSSIEFGFNPKQVTLDNRNCRTNGLEAICSTLKYCLKYQSANVGSISLNVTILLDIRHKGTPRLFFFNTFDFVRTRDVKLNNEIQSCYNETVYIQSDITDKITPLMASIKLNLPKSSQLLPPILNELSPKDNTTTLTIVRNCGPDNICVPNLILNVKQNMTQYVQGSGDKLSVDISIHNKGEEAYESKFLLTLSKFINYKEVERNSTNTTILCSPPSVNNEYKLDCDIGNPFPSGASAHLRIIFIPQLDLFQDVKTMSLIATVSSSNDETLGDERDNTWKLNLPFLVQNKWTISGYSEPRDITLHPEEIAKDKTHNYPFTQFYILENDGPSDIISAEVVIQMSLVKDGMKIVELSSQPIVENRRGDCDPIPGINDVSMKENNDVQIIRCRIYHMLRSQTANIRVTAKIISANIAELSDEQVNVQSTVTATITRLPFDVPISDGKKSSTVTFTVSKQALLQAMPWPVIAGSVAGALVISAIIAVILWKCGFFKRNRPGVTSADVQQQEEKEPLRNKKSKD